MRDIFIRDSDTLNQMLIREPPKRTGMILEVSQLDVAQSQVDVD